MKKIYHITNSPIDIKRDGFKPSGNIPEVPNDDLRIQEVSRQEGISYPINRKNANFFYPRLDDIPYDYQNSQVVVVRSDDISKKAYVANRDIRDDIVFGSASDNKIVSYLESIQQCTTSEIHKFTNRISGTPEVVIHGHISPQHISKVDRGKFLS